MDKTQGRLLSLDVFRGITVAFMIIVNNPGDWDHIYWPLEHAAWNGCTPTDLVFPFFLFIVGVSIPFANQNVKLGNEKYKKTLIRGLKLFGLGLFLSLFPKFNIDVVRIMGVLQRIALVYIICSLLFFNLNIKGFVFALFFCLILYYFLMNFVAVPGFGDPNLGAETNFGAWLDRTILTEPHLWKTAKTWDPEGLLGTIPAVGNGIFGILAGNKLLEKNTEALKKVKWLFLVGILAISIGLCWDILGFPINKSLWTSSYTLYTSGLGLCFLGILYFIIDIKNYTRFTNFFVVFGVNAIAVFFLAGLIPRILGMIKLTNVDGTPIGLKNWIYVSLIAPIFNDPKNASLAGATSFLLIFYIICYCLWRNKIFIKV